MIDAQAIVIQYLKTKSGDLGTSQIAAKHRFNETGGWAADTSGIVIRPDGGQVDLYQAVQVPRLEVRLYGEEPSAINSLYAALVVVMRATSRVAVSLPDAGVDGLLQYLLPVSGLSVLNDIDINKEFGLVFLEALVNETAVA